MSFDADLDLAFERADLAGRIALELFQRKRFQVSQKLDGSLLTAVDRAVESAIRAHLADERPANRSTASHRLAVSATQPLSKATISDDWRGSLRSGVVDSPLASVLRSAHGPDLTGAMPSSRWRRA